MAGFEQDFEDRARDAQPALHRLVWVGVRAEHDRPAAVRGPRELGAQQRGGVGLVRQLRLEIETRREAEVRVARARVTIDAAVFAATIRIDARLKADVGAVICCDDGAAIVL